MGKKTVFLAILLATLASSNFVHAAVISWILPTSYTNGTPIAEADIQRIVVKVYTGPSATGPWALALTTPPGATSGTGPDPLPGETLWYAVTSTLDGMESALAQPVSKTAPAEPPPPPPPPPAPKIPAPPEDLRISSAFPADRERGHG